MPWGFPVYEETAAAAGIDRVDLSDVQASIHKVAGNSMAGGLFAVLQIHLQLR